MRRKCALAALVSMVCVTAGLAQPTAAPFPETPAASGEPAADGGGAAPSAGEESAVPDRPLRAVSARGAASLAKTSAGNGMLPNDQGQIYREYEITPYTNRVTSTNTPEQAVVDWILRETGYEVWHTGPAVSLLHADHDKVRVYHTPEIQAVVGEIIDRFVNPSTETQMFGVRVVSLDNPNWRSRALPVLRPVAVQTQGVQAWLLAKEDASLLLADLRRRSDFREHTSPNLLMNNGQPTVVSLTRPRQYARGIITRPEVWPGFDIETGQIDEGFSLEFAPLLSLDGSTIDAVVKCNIDQVERLNSVSLDVASVVTNRQQAKIEVPQISQVRLHERFRWPVEQVLLVGLGIVPPPTASESSGLRLPLVSSAPERADLLFFIECRGKTGQLPSATQTTAQPGAPGQELRGRY